MSQYSSILKKYPQIIASFFVGDATRMEEEEINELRSKLISLYPELIRVNLRYSGTEPIFRMMLESGFNLSEEELAKIALELSEKIQSKSGISDGEIHILNCTRGGLISIEN